MSQPRPISARGFWLAPFGHALGAAAAARRFGYSAGLLRRRSLAGPVISVGNLSVGGSGKTPLVEWLARTIRDAGIPVAILSRGYGGTFRGDALIVSSGDRIEADATTAGDEPFMLATALPGVVVAVGRRRDRVGHAVEERFGRRAHVLDDGFQHLRLHRDLDLLCLEVADLADRPLPAGRLREFAGAERRADLVLIARADEIPNERLAANEAQLGEERSIRTESRVLGVFDLDGQPVAPPRRAFLLSGIARPERFEKDVPKSGAEVVGAARFPDHHRFTASELDRVAQAARRSGADAIVTTAKDAVRFSPAPTFEPPLRVLRTTVAFPKEHEERLRARVFEIARRAA